MPPQNSNLHLIVLPLLLLLSTAQSQSTFTCQQGWRSDGNYYDLNKCIQLCTSANNYQNVTNIDQLTLDCCTPICHDEIAYHTGKRTAIIVVCSVLLFLVLVCCIFGCFGPNIKKKYVLFQEAKKRKIVKIGCSVEEFDRYAGEFEGLFTEEMRDTWEMYFVVEGQKIPMQWFSLQFDRVSNYQYKMVILGQDMYGSFKINGYLVNTEKGPTIWGVKNFDNVQNSSIFFERQSELVHQIVRLENSDYEGIWYNRNHANRTGQCAIKKKGEQIRSHEEIDHFQIVSG